MFQPLVSRSWRWIGAAYAVIFLGATTASPHRHLNGIEDLLSDDPSDSGSIVAGIVPGDAAGPLIAPLRVLDDDPCLACFPHDFVAAPSCVFVLHAPSRPLGRIEPLSRASAPQPGDRPPASRSPPAAV